MMMRQVFYATVPIVIALNSCLGAEVSGEEHPFFRDTMYPAWSAMTPQQLRIDVDEGIRRARERTEALLRISEKEVTFENSFLAYSRATEELDQLMLYAYHIYTACNTQADFMPTLNELAPSIHACRHRLNNIYFIRQLLQMVEISPQGRRLSPAKKRFMKSTLERFPNVLMPDMEKQRTQLQQELSRLMSSYEHNITQTNNTWYYLFKDIKQLAGVPPHVLQAMAQEAKQRGFADDEHPGWLITPKSPAINSVLKYCTVEFTRQKCWQGIKSPGNTRSGNNGPTVLRILQLRHALAEYAGYKNHADFKLHNRMMKNGKAALALVNSLLKRFEPIALKQNAAILTEASRYYKENITAVQPWDIEFFKNRAAAKQQAFNPAQLRPYFEYENTLQGLFTHSGELFGLSIRELPAAYPAPGEKCPAGKIEVWAPKVRVFGVYDAASGTHYGSFYLDAYARAGKNTGARCQMLKVGNPKVGGGVGEPHLAAMMLELQAPAAGKPHLLSHLELRMLFHEFGHMLHQMLGHGELREQASHSQALDFIELPAHLHENRAWEPEVLCSFARHYKTGKPLPTELAKQLAASRYSTAQEASVLSKLLLAKLDLEAHTAYPQKFHGKALDNATQALLAPWLVPTTAVQPSVLRNLPHCIYVGYDANLYSYVLADVMAADVYEVFKQHGINNTAIGRSYRKAILEPGNSAPPDVLYRNFMGRDVSPNAYLNNIGLGTYETDLHTGPLRPEAR